MRAGNLVIILHVARKVDVDARIDQQRDVGRHGERTGDIGIVACAVHREFNGLPGTRAACESSLNACAIQIGHGGIDRGGNIVTD